MKNFSHQTATACTLLLGIATVAFLFWVIRWMLSRNRRGFTDFFIGDTGKLSIARLQAVAWAFVVITFQVSVLFALCFNSNPAVRMRQFSLEFSPNVLWLLGLSLTSYVAVKGITVNQIARGEQAYKRYRPQLADLITSENGLDFSKFQMLIWTLLALFVYMGSAYNFIELTYGATTAESVAVLFNASGSKPAQIPDIDSSFIVLMGLSQGVYVGKKLIPSFQLDRLRTDKQQELNELKVKLEERRMAFQTILKNLQPVTDADRRQYALMQTEIEELTRRLNEAERTLEEINQHIAP